MNDKKNKKKSERRREVAMAGNHADRVTKDSSRPDPNAIAGRRAKDGHVHTPRYR